MKFKLRLVHSFFILSLLTLSTAIILLDFLIQQESLKLTATTLKPHVSPDLGDLASIRSKEMTDYSEGQQMYDAGPTQWGKRAGDLRLSVSARDNLFRVGEKIIYSLTYKNEGAKTVILPDFLNFKEDFKVSVLNENGKEVARLGPQSKFAGIFLNSINHPIPRIEAYQPLEVPLYILPNGLFDLTKPGVYFLSVKGRYYDGGGTKPIWVESNITQFEVVENEKEFPIRGEVQEGLELTALVEKETFQSGSSIPVQVILKNVSKNLYEYSHFAIERDFEIIIKRKDTKEVLLTRYGYQVKNHPEESMIQPNPPESMAPLGMLEGTLVVDKLFDMKAPGEYTIQLKRRVPKLVGEGWADLQSNPITVTVTK